MCTPFQPGALGSEKRSIPLERSRNPDYNIDIGQKEARTTCPTHQVKTAEELSAIFGDLRRARILEILTQRPASATQLAKLIGESPQTTHYHMKRLEEAGLIKMVRKREVRGTVEKFYRAVADRFVLSRAIGRESDSMRAWIDMAHELLLSGAYYLGTLARPPYSTLTVRVVKTDSQTARTLGESLDQTLKGFTDAPPGEQAGKYALVVGLLPLAPDTALPEGLGFITAEDAGTAEPGEAPQPGAA